MVRNLFEITEKDKNKSDCGLGNNLIIEFPVLIVIINWLMRYCFTFTNYLLEYLIAKAHTVCHLISEECSSFSIRNRVWRSLPQPAGIWIKLEEVSCR